MSWPATTVGLVIIIFSTSLVKSKSKATWAASKDLPDPALPFKTVTVLCKILVLASFCSSFKVSLKVIGFLGFDFLLKAC